MDSVFEHTVHKPLDFEDTEDEGLKKVRTILLETGGKRIFVI